MKALRFLGAATCSKYSWKDTALTCLCVLWSPPGGITEVRQIFLCFPCCISLSFKMTSSINLCSPLLTILKEEQNGPKLQSRAVNERVSYAVHIGGGLCSYSMIVLLWTMNQSARLFTKLMLPVRKPLIKESTLSKMIAYIHNLSFSVKINNPWFTK